MRTETRLTNKGKCTTRKEMSVPEEKPSKTQKIIKEGQNNHKVTDSTGTETKDGKTFK